ncbi:MAG: metalloregulator ArsR/SmtB family transcription factor [Salinibacterium sp.]|nr:metalloregulator ArsR/SmtB family transcription factor [Salinibacterium sp.]
MLPVNASDPPTVPLGRPEAEQIARNLRAMADPTRIQILDLLLEASGGRRPVTELADALGLTQPTVSHHLRVMADEGLVDRLQEGRQVWYSIAQSRMTEVFDSVRADPVTAVVAPPVLDRIAADLATRFTGTFSAQTVTEYVHGSYSLLADRARITRYLPSLTARFAADRLQALALADGLTTDRTPEVLFVCVHNAGRSQLASAILRSLAGDRVRVLTAGSEPAGSISPKIIAALDEIGIPVGGEYPKPLTDEVVRAADYVITMGCGDACPIYSGRRYLDWDLPDPAELSMEAVRAVRDDIDTRVRGLLAEIDSMNTP